MLKVIQVMLKTLANISQFEVMEEQVTLHSSQTLLFPLGSPAFLSKSSEQSKAVEDNLVFLHWLSLWLTNGLCPLLSKSKNKFS